MCIRDSLLTSPLLRGGKSADFNRFLIFFQNHYEKKGSLQNNQVRRHKHNRHKLAAFFGIARAF